MRIVYIHYDSFQKSQALEAQVKLDFRSLQVLPSFAFGTPQPKRGLRPPHGQLPSVGSKELSFGLGHFQVTRSLPVFKFCLGLEDQELPYS